MVCIIVPSDKQEKETDGPGLGYVDVFSTQGILLARMQNGPWMNASYGVSLAPLDLGRFSHDLLVGQYAGAGNTENSGVIAAFDPFTGKFDGLLEDFNGNTLSIKGIRSLNPANSGAILANEIEGGSTNISSFDPDEQPAVEVYFTAGSGTTSHFGYLNARQPIDGPNQPTDLIQGGAQ